MARPVAKLMEDGAVIIDLVVKCRLGRNADSVQLRDITGNLAANLEAGTRCGNQGLGAGDKFALLVWRGNCGETCSGKPSHCATLNTV